MKFLANHAAHLTMCRVAFGVYTPQTYTRTSPTGPTSMNHLPFVTLLSLSLLTASTLAVGCSDDGEDGSLFDQPTPTTTSNATSSTTTNETTGGSTTTPTSTSTTTSNTSATTGSTSTSSTSNTSSTTTPPDDAGGDATDAQDDTPDAQDDPIDDIQPDVPDEPDTPTQPVERSCSVALRFDGNASSTVQAAGSFNGWDPELTPLTRDGDVWTTDLVLPPGNYPFKFVIDGEYEGNPPPNVYTQWEGNFENRSLRIPDCTKPTWDILTPPAFDETGTLETTIQFVRGNGAPALDPDTLLIRLGDTTVTPVSVDPESGLVEIRYEAPEFGKYSLRVQAADTAGTTTEDPTLYIPVWYEAEPFVWQDSVLYLIFTDRFRDTDNVDHRLENVQERANYLGGDFRGIIQAIEEGYFARMGVNTLWLSPVYDNTDNGYRDKRDPSKLMSGFHGYWPISLDPEPRYGDTEADAPTRLLQLTRTAHANGMRVVFDLALNHVHEDHPYCQEHPEWCSLTCECGSPGCGWDPSERGIDCQFDYFLPDLSYRNHAIVERVLADTLDMIERYDVDGLRIDAARHMDHVIMRSLRMILRDNIEAKGGSPYYLVGETFTDDRGQIMDYVSDHELHGQFDFAMRSAIRNTFVFNGSFRSLDDAVNASASDNGYGRFVHWMSPFFGNHDIDRTATLIAGNDQGPWGDTPDLMALGPDDNIDQWDIINRMSMAYAFLLTYKGIPLLYYGDEIGLAGSQDPDNRRLMMWDHNANQRELLNRVRTLGQARRDVRALRHGQRRELWKDQDLYVFAKISSPQDCAIVALNKGPARTETVTVPPELGLQNLTLQSYNSTRTLSIQNDQTTVTLDPWEYAIFTCQNFPQD